MSRELCITIPCEPASGPDRFAPVLFFRGFDATGADRTYYECPHCHGKGPRRKPIAQHMGLYADKPVTCRVLLAQDEQRRKDGKETKT